ncbi:elongation factor Tu [Purpureocillium lilacinum]|uniref:Elongation factor Tu n=1 Tax=Purpureocillium lilacinum TaxID=33203 RepID=A0A179FK72_PURLI|nr:elongation factor Tu [Purpureocillium lilacinum]
MALPNYNICILGHHEHGKTTLAGAMTRVCSEVFDSAVVEFDKLDSGSSETGSPEVEFNSNIHRFLCKDYKPDVKNLSKDASTTDAAILVVSAADGPMPQTKEHISLARQSQIPQIIVFLNTADLVDDTELLELVEMEVRDLLSTDNYPGDDTPVIIGSARWALNGKDDNRMGTTQKLVETMDTYIKGRTTT